jgi:FAD/FMN-containing dehydrogenase
MSTASAIHGSRLADIVGPSNVITDPAQLAAYTIDKKVPSAAARPQSTEEIFDLVKFAVKEKLAIVAWACRRASTISRST